MEEALAWAKALAQQPTPPSCVAQMKEANRQLAMAARTAEDTQQTPSPIAEQ
jgi:hypothetical protein